ncbi:hypothetical protein AB0C59_23500 [Streptomyces sp. NPDC048664]|uniref:hypothetical protein n=1 Tax=Streptomyces sp. NPDC048664 TaxID=3154505 RepID=UPI0034152E24
MTKLRVEGSGPVDLEGEMASLRRDGARMAPHWAPPARSARVAVSPAAIHGVRVPVRSARALEAMSEYGG